MSVTNIAPITEGITSGQIGRVMDRFSERCRVNASSLPKNLVQMVLEDEGDALAKEMFEVFRARVERNATLIIRKVRVNRTRTPQQALDATGRAQYTDRAIVDNMPTGDQSCQESDEVEVIFFKLGRLISNADLEKEFELRGLTPADPYTLAAMNEADPAFANKYPNVTHWKDTTGNWCFASFRRWDVDRTVIVRRIDFDWYAGWWFAGVRKSV